MNGNHLQWQFLTRAWHADNLSQGYLFAGNDRDTMSNVAFQLSMLRYCETPLEQNLPCTHCASCLAVQQRRHPDVIYISRNPEKKDIPIEAIRHLSARLSVSSHTNTGKTILIADAHDMNNSAQSAFLKILEEPKGNVLYVLLSEYPAFLLQTVRSRVQTLPFYTLNPEGAEPSSPLAKEAARLMTVSLADRFEYAKKLSETPEKALHLLFLLLAETRKTLLGAIHSRNPAVTQQQVTTVRTLQDMIFYMQRSNMSTRLALETAFISL